MKEKIKKALMSDTAIKIYEFGAVALITLSAAALGATCERQKIVRKLLKAQEEFEKTGKPVEIEL